MITAARTSIVAADIKTKARALGADLVGIADGAAIDAHPPTIGGVSPRPSAISAHDASRVIVVGKRLNLGSTRLIDWHDRHKHYNDELTIAQLEEMTLDMVYWLEDQGIPALAMPPTYVDPTRYLGTPQEISTDMLSANHAAVEAGLGTLGLNGQLLTPEFGPRVMLALVLCGADVAADAKRADALCLGPSCGRCLLTCPADAVGHWARDFPACNKYRAPFGFHRLADLLTRIVHEGDVEKQSALIQSKDSAELFEGVLRGVGIMTGCRRCNDVCPVGADYETSLRDRLDHIPEATDEKRTRLAAMVEAEAKGMLPASHAEMAHWIGRQPPAPR